MPMRRRARRSSRWPSAVISVPLRMIVPPVGSTSRLMQRTTVDFPAPDGPIRAMSWPSGRSKSIPFTARSPARYRFSRPLMRSMCVAPRRGLHASFAGIFHPGRRVDLADDAPVLLVVDRDEAVLLLELGLEARALPREGEERLLDLLDQLGIEIVGIAVARGGESLRLVDRADFCRIHHLAIDHPLHHLVGDRRRVIVLVGDPHDRVVVLSGKDRLEIALGLEIE